MADINTIIAQGSLVKGRLSGDEDVVVIGRVEGEIALSRTLYVEASGVVIADVSVDQVVIGGTLVGDVHARTAAQVTATGRVVGNISSPRIVVVEGAALRGRLDTETNVAETRQREVTPSAYHVSASAPTPVSAPPVEGSVVGRALPARPVAETKDTVEPPREASPVAVTSPEPETEAAVETETVSTAGSSKKKVEKKKAKAQA